MPDDAWLLHSLRGHVGLQVPVHSTLPAVPFSDESGLFGKT